IHETIITNYNQCIHCRFHGVHAGCCLCLAFAAFAWEWTGVDAYCKDAHLFRDFSDDWSSSCTGSAAHACCNEDHVGTLQCIFDLFTGFLSRFFTDIRVCTGTERSEERRVGKESWRGGAADGEQAQKEETTQQHKLQQTSS